MIPMQKKTNQSIKKRFFSATILKPIICASTVFLADRFILKNLNTKSNIAFKFFKMKRSAKKTVDAQMIGFRIVAEKNLFLID